MLRHNCQDLDRHPIRMRVVARNELDPTNQQLCRHEDTTGQAIDARNQEQSSRSSRVRYGKYESRSILKIVFASRLDLFVGRDNWIAILFCIGMYSIALSSHAQSIDTLHL
jgi:hypothetical protein